MQLTKYIFSVFFILVIISFTYYRNAHAAIALTRIDGCSIWENYLLDDIRFRCCTSKDIQGSIDFQFYNNYNDDINLILAINYNDGTSANASVTIPAGRIANKQLHTGANPLSWKIVKKQKKDKQGNWVDF